MPMPSDDVFAAGEQLFRRLEHMHELLSDTSRSSVRIVLNLEKMVIKEAQRSLTYFHLYGYPTDLVVVNRVLPPDAGPYFASWLETQRRYWPMVEERFAPVPSLSAPYFDREVVGVEMLRQLAAALFGDTDPTRFYYQGRPYHVRREDGTFVLSLELPFTTREDVAVSRFADELVLQVGSWRRNLILPRALVEAQTTGARFEGHTLNISFAAPAREGKGG
jgi:arsenite-transporting ATPase